MYLFLAFIIFLILYIYYKRAQKFKAFNSFPGPPGLPIIGNLLDLGSNTTEVLSNLQKYQKEYGDVYKLWVGPLYPTLIICDARNIETILSSTVHIKKSTSYKIFNSFLGEGLITNIGNEKWRKHRKLLTPAFHFKILERFLYTFHELGSTLLKKFDELADGDGFDVFPYISRYTLDAICETSMGLQLNVQDNPEHVYLKNLVDYEHKFTMRQFSLIGRNEELYKYTLDYSDWSKCVNKIKSFSENVIQEKHKQWEIRKQSNEKPDAKEPFLDLLFRVWDKGEISMEEIREELDTFMFAGHDTTATTISFCLFELAKHQDVQKKILEEVYEIIGKSDDQFTISNLSNLKYLDTVVKEVMRIYTTVPLIERAVADHLELNGKVIPIGTTLLLFLYGLHNSEKNYTDAKKFDPSRFSLENTVNKDPFLYVPFSAGTRNCIGQRFALLEVKASLVKIIKNFILLPVEPEHQLQLAANTILKSLNGAQIRVRRRS